MNSTPNARLRHLPCAALLIAALTVSAFAARDGHCMTVLYGELPDLVRSSELVLHGKITDVQVIDRRKEGRAVWTEYTLSVYDVWKGDRKVVGKTFRWRHVGGSTADGMTMHVPGMPTFKVGEETVVLLERHSEGHVLTGATQGKFNVNANTKGVKYASRNLGGVNLMRRDAKGHLVSVRGKHSKHEHGHILPPPEAPQPVHVLREAVLAWVKADAAQRKSATAATVSPRVRRATPVKPAGKVKP